MLRPVSTAALTTSATAYDLDGGGDVRMSSSSIAPWMGQEGMGPERLTGSFNFEPHLRHQRPVGSPSSGSPGARISGLSQLRDKPVMMSTLVSSPSRARSDRPAMHATPFRTDR